MASYTITTTDEQEALLSWICSTFNAEHDASLTNQQFVALRFPQLIEPFVARYTAYLNDLLQTKFNEASAETQNTVLALLAIT